MLQYEDTPEPSNFGNQLVTGTKFSLLPVVNSLAVATMSRQRDWGLPSDPMNIFQSPSDTIMTEGLSCAAFAELRSSTGLEAAAAAAMVARPRPRRRHNHTALLLGIIMVADFEFHRILQ
jgi:hypothetical protein